MSIIDFVQNKKEDYVYSQAQKVAIVEFEKQRDAIRAIAGSQGYAEIMTYLRRECEAAEVHMDNTRNKETRNEMFIVMRTLRNLKRFLDNLVHED